MAWDLGGIEQGTCINFQTLVLSRECNDRGSNSWLLRKRAGGGAGLRANGGAGGNAAAAVILGIGVPKAVQGAVDALLHSRVGGLIDG
jgi:hypothetical protein